MTDQWTDEPIGHLMDRFLLLALGHERFFAAGLTICAACLGWSDDHVDKDR